MTVCVERYSQFLDAHSGAVKPDHELTCQWPSYGERIARECQSVLPSPLTSKVPPQPRITSGSIRSVYTLPACGAAFELRPLDVKEEERRTGDGRAMLHLQTL